MNENNQLKPLLYDEMSKLVEPDVGQNYASPELVIVQHQQFTENLNKLIGQPFLMNEGRVILVMQGNVRYNVNLRTVEVEPQTGIVLPQGAIIVVEYMSPDLDVKAFVYKNLPPSEVIDTITLLRPDSDAFNRACEYIRLMNEVAHKQRSYSKTIEHLQLAFFQDMKQTATTPINVSATTRSHTDRVFNTFIDLVNKHGVRERRIDFYARQLFLSPNRLSAIVKEQSGQTVLQWVNQRTIMQAKALLVYSDNTIYFISDELGFQNATAFSRFFRRETGMSPMEFRKQTNDNHFP